MSTKKGVVLLACGSFNPPTNMHLRMFELARDHLHRMDSHVVLGGIISPVHDAYGKNELEAAKHRKEMVNLALKTNDWVKLSDWELSQESWSRTKQVLSYHQNHLNEYIHSQSDICNNIKNQMSWLPENTKNNLVDSVTVKLLCGADLLESFGTPGLWSNEDIETIVGRHGLVVVSRNKYNPQEFIYNSDLLTKYMSNIIIVTEWIRNEVSSTKIRRSLKRGESVRYLIPDAVIDYIEKKKIYGYMQKHL